MSILVSGSLVYDHIMDFPDSFKNHILPENIHILNVSFAVNKLERSWGGTAGNIAYTLKLLNETPLIVSALGKDSEAYLKHWQKCGLAKDYILIDEAQLTASAYITTDADDNQITAFYGGPLARGLEIDLAEIKNKEKIKLAIISPTAKEVMQKHLKQSRELGWETVFDPGQQITSFTGGELRQMFTWSDFLLGNDYEIRLLEQKTGWTLPEILKNVKVIITTLGAEGSVIKIAKGEEIKIGVCPPLSADDPTGAGDAYRAGFFAGYARDLTLKICGQMGAVAAAYAIETYGTQAHSFTLEEFYQRYQKTFQDDIKKVFLQN